MVKKFLAASTLAATLAFIGCASLESSLNAHASSAITLQNNTWFATEVNGSKIQLDNMNRPALTFDATGKRFGGADGCNKIQGSYESNGQQIRLGQIAGTLMACQGNQDTISRQFNDALAKTAAYEIKGHELKFLDQSGKTVAKFVTVVPAM